MGQLQGTRHFSLAVRPMAYREIDKVCRDNAVASRPRTPKKSKADQEKAIMNKVLDIPLPIGNQTLTTKAKEPSL